MNSITSSRLDILDKVLKTKTSKNSCIKRNKILNNEIKLTKKIGQSSRIATIYKACFPLNCKYEIAIKKIPLSEDDKKILKNNIIFSEMSLKYSFIWREILMLKLTNELVKQNICPHLPLVYYYNICEDKCTFQNIRVKKSETTKNIKDCLLLANELAEGDFKTYLNKHNPSINELEIVYFQIYIGLFCIYKYFNIIHNDLHWGNVLFHKIPKGGYIKYIIDGDEIVIPNIGYLFILWDFEFSVIYDKIIPEYVDLPDNIWDDFIRITKMLDYKKKIGKKDEDIQFKSLYNKLILLMKMSLSTKDFVKNYGLYLHDKYTEDKQIILNVYNTDKKLKNIDNIIKKYLIQ